MRLFKLNRRGQIRGIDFSLSIIIFSLTITQILILTTTLIDGNRTLIQLDQQSEVTDSLATELLQNTGFGFSTSDWATISTPQLTSSTWNLGLSSAGKIDPFKLGRLSNRSLTDWVLGYEDVLQGLNFSQPLSLEILNPIDIQIEAIVDDSLSTITVDGHVTKLHKPLNLAEVWVYSINRTQDIAQAYGITDIDGGFSIDLVYSTISAEPYTLIAFTKYGESSQDADVTEYHPVGAVTYSPISVFSSNSGSGYTVNVTSEFDPTVDSGDMFAFFPGIASGVANYSQLVLAPIVGTNFWSTDSIGIPQTGMVVFVGMGYQGTTLQSTSIIKFPVTLDNQHSSTIIPPITQQSTSTTTITSFVVRGIALQLQLTTWEY